MLLITKSVFVMMSSFILSCILAIFLIPILKKKANQTLSIYLKQSHRQKEKTPTMGGIIFTIPTIVIMLLLCLFNKIEMNYSLLIVMISFFGYFLIGLIDDVLIVVKHNNKGLSEGAKLLFQLIIAIIFFYLFMLAGNEPLLWIHSLNFKLNIGWFYGLFILLVLLASSNAVNLTDGLDGLAGGLSFIAILTFGIICYNTAWLEGYEELGLMCFALLGSLMSFLVFNLNPARIFMGDTGSLALGAFLGSIAILTRHELLLVLIGIVFVVETMTCVIQRVYYKFTHKRIFPMTPIHHTFEKIGWSEVSIVRMFWLIGIIASMIALMYGVWL